MTAQADSRSLSTTLARQLARLTRSPRSRPVEDGEDDIRKSAATTPLGRAVSVALEKVEGRSSDFVDSARPRGWATRYASRLLIGDAIGVAWPPSEPTWYTLVR